MQRAALQLRDTSPTQGQSQEAEQETSRQAVSRPVKRATQMRWRHVAKVYGMSVSPWISETKLANCLSYEEGLDLSEDHSCYDLVNTLNVYVVKGDERRDPQFASNASFVSLIPTLVTS